MKRRNPAFIILIFLFWYYSTIRERKKPLLQDVFHKVRVTNLTQGGLKAMEELGKLEEERRAAGGTFPGRQTGAASAGEGSRRLGVQNAGGRRYPAAPKGAASDEMCVFLILNISSLQLIPMNVVAYRSQYGSVNPTAIVGPAILATAVSTLAGVVFCKVMDGKRRV